MMRLLALLLAAVASSASAATQCADGDGDWIIRACYAAPRTSLFYGHNILGDTPEWLCADTYSCSSEQK